MTDSPDLDNPIDRKPSSPRHWWTGPLAPFQVRSFRFQWPSDTLVSWAFEMENLILGWFILTETGSVTYLTIYGALIFVGTLLAALVADMANLMNLNWADWKPVIFSAVSAAIVVVLNALNWNDPRYGIGAAKE